MNANERRSGGSICVHLRSSAVEIHLDPRCIFMHNYCKIMSSAVRKTDRQSLIVEIVRGRKVATQTELRDALKERGVECDQGTVSRDIRELGLVKAAAEDGEYYYSVIADVSPA